MSNSAGCFQMPPGQSLKLTVYYRTPSLNVTKRQHWSDQFKEKKKAFAALLSALLATASNPLTQTTSPEASRICSMAYATLKSSLAMNPGASTSKPRRSASGNTKTRKPKSK